MRRRLRLVYAAGPGDVIGTYRHWKEGRDDPSQVAITYSSQFYDVARELNAKALLISSYPSYATFAGGNFRIEHRPIPFSNKGGCLYHFGAIFAAIRLLCKSWWFGANVLIVCDGSGHWFLLRLAPWLGIRLIPTLHCVLWLQGERPSLVKRCLRSVSRPFFTKSASQILSISGTITRQLEELTGCNNLPVRQFIPTYRRDQFDSIPPVPSQRPLFRVFFAGRIERNKGVFNLLEIAKRFERENRSHIEFDLAGDGSSLADLKLATAQAGQGVVERFRLPGFLKKEQMRDLFSRSHAVIVPTTSDFVEGFNKSVAEGVLSGRPVITSSVCPALEYVREAVVEVPPDDIKAYGDAILQLSEDTALYEEKVAGCQRVSEQFYDVSRGWGAMLKTAILASGLLK